MEVPFLGRSTVRNFDDHVSVIDQIKISTIWQLTDDMEVSFNIETESLVELTLCRFTLPLINIHNVPLLTDLTMNIVDNDVLVLSVNSTLYIESFVVFDVSNESSIKSEQLPPS